ncbi:hypothetical protein EJ02DRAFT_67631 [Clathrospora elynae]|uniref:Uncharacterized protein n=1 Tax=Clathrospora elynae TaxID=706981 RepID=A0A6A5SXY6_9PLEO|nr:hypothetical protein EJ02DRAFT_67631 [Clathrospora elynae]
MYTASIVFCLVYTHHPVFTLISDPRSCMQKTLKGINAQMQRGYYHQKKCRLHPSRLSICPSLYEWPREPGGREAYTFTDTNVVDLRGHRS